jgi:hypothetical protein
MSRTSARRHPRGAHHAETDFARLRDADMVVEAVFEDRAIKAEVTKKLDAVLPRDLRARHQHLGAADHPAGAGLGGGRSASSACISSRRPTRCRWSR